MSKSSINVQDISFKFKSHSSMFESFHHYHNQRLLRHVFKNSFLLAFTLKNQNDTFNLILRFFNVIDY